MTDADSPDDGGVRCLVELLDGLEARAEGYVTRDDLRAAGVAEADVEQALAQGVLLVDERLRLAGPGEAPQPVTLCRLNRHHPLVRALTASG